MACDGNCMYPHMPVFILSHMQDFIQQANQTPTLQQAFSVILLQIIHLQLHVKLSFHL